MLAMGFVTGVEPDKWIRRFRGNTAHGGVEAREMSDPVAALRDAELDLALVRLPDPRIDASFHVIHLYVEEPGVAVPKDSVFAEAGEPLTPVDIAGEPVNYRIAADGTVDIDELRTALQVVAANVGVAVAPRPALKVLSRKQVVPLGFLDNTFPATNIALVFPRERDSDAIQDFIGIAKGRTPNSSRQAAPKRTAREKAEARKQRREKDTRSTKRTTGRRGNPRRGGRRS